MAALYITEYELAYNGVPAEPALAHQKVTISGTSAQSAAFNERTKFVRISVDGITSVLFGVDPTAEATHQRLIVGETRDYYTVGGYKVAGITNT
jgi:hypothetical protein